MRTEALKYINNYMTEKQGWDIDEMASYRRRVFAMYQKEVDHIIAMNEKANGFMGFFKIFGFNKHNFEYNSSKELAELAINRVHKIFEGKSRRWEGMNNV